MTICMFLHEEKTTQDGRVLKFDLNLDDEVLGVALEALNARKEWERTDSEVDQLLNNMLKVMYDMEGGLTSFLDGKRGEKIIDDANHEIQLEDTSKEEEARLYIEDPLNHNVSMNSKLNYFDINDNDNYSEVFFSYAINYQKDLKTKKLHIKLYTSVIFKKHSGEFNLFYHSSISSKITTKMMHVLTTYMTSEKKHYGEDLMKKIQKKTGFEVSKQTKKNYDNGEISMVFEEEALHDVLNVYKVSYKKRSFEMIFPQSMFNKSKYQGGSINEIEQITFGENDMDGERKIILSLNNNEEKVQRIFENMLMEMGITLTGEENYMVINYNQNNINQVVDFFKEFKRLVAPEIDKLPKLKKEKKVKKKKTVFHQ
jgi:hypothetical protein